MMLGIKLQGAERWKAWGAVVLFTLLSILQNMGNFMPAYLYEKVRTCVLHPTAIKQLPRKAHPELCRACRAEKQAEPLTLGEGCLMTASTVMI